VAAERPALGETHPRDDVERDDVNPPPIPLQLAQRPPRPLKPPHGTLTHITGQTWVEDPDTFDGINGMTAANGPAREARFDGINGMTAASDGSLFVSDSRNNVIRKISNGVVSTLAGSGDEGNQDGVWDVAQFCDNCGVTLDEQGRLLVASEYIRAVVPNGDTTTLAHFRYAPDLLEHSTNHIVAAPDGSIFVSDVHAILKISTDGTHTTIAGDRDWDGFVDGSGNVARFNDIQGMAITASGMLVVCDMKNDRLRSVDPNNGHVATIDLHIPHPVGVSCSSDGTLYVVASRSCLLYEINRSHVKKTFRHSLLPYGLHLSCVHLDEPNGLVYMSTEQQIFTVSVLSLGERRAAHIFPLVRTWALVQQDRAHPCTGNAHAVLSRLMRFRVVGVLALVLRFAY
jgi:sugar lactone lactonase YvrE